MDLIYLLIIATVLLVMNLNYRDVEESVGFREDIEVFKPVDIPYCEVARARRVECFTYYVKGVFKLWP